MKIPNHPHPIKELPHLPASFKAYHCDTCDKIYEWWQLPQYYTSKKGYSAEAKWEASSDYKKWRKDFPEVAIHYDKKKKEIKKDEVMETLARNKPFYLINTEPRENFTRAQIFEAFPDKQIKSTELYNTMKKAGLDITEEQARSSFNKMYKELNEGHIRMIRCPEDKERLFDEKFDCMQFGENVEYSDLFNKRGIRQWDFQFVSSLDKARKNIVDNDNIKYKDRWLAAIDFFKKISK